MTIHILPMPSPRSCRRKYKFRDLAVGECFIVPCSTEQPERRRMWNTLTSTRGKIQRMTGRKFAIRTIEGGLGVWRTA